MAIRLDEGIAASEDAIDHFEGWLSNVKEWTEMPGGYGYRLISSPNPNPRDLPRAPHRG